MHRSLRFALAPFVFAAVLTSASFAADPGYVDFGKFTAGKGEFVQVDLGRGVIKLASFFARQGDPAVAEVMRGISRVRINVVGLDHGNRAATTERMTAVRADLVREGWEQIVAVQGKKQEDVAIFLKQRDGEVVEGIVVTVMDEGKQEAVFINVVGHIRPEQMALVGEHLKIKHLAATGTLRRL